MTDTVELDLELDAALEAELNAPMDPIPLDNPILEKEEKEYQFEAIPRRNAIYLRGVDEMSTADITSYANTPLLQKVQWINDSSCNLVFDNEEQAMEVAQTLLHEPTASLDHHTLLPAKPFTHNDRSFELFIRVATDEDVKEKGARAKSRYYMIHGTDDEPLTSERKEVRKEHVERMSKNGGDGRDVFSRLGNRVQRSRSRSPSREATRSTRRERSIEREIPQHLKDRLGPRKE